MSGAEYLKISDDAAAMDFNRACNLALIHFDREQREEMAKLIAFEVSKIFGDGESR